MKDDVLLLAVAANAQDRLHVGLVNQRHRREKSSASSARHHSDETLAGFVCEHVRFTLVEKRDMEPHVVVLGNGEEEPTIRMVFGAPVLSAFDLSQSAAGDLLRLGHNRVFEVAHSDLAGFDLILLDEDVSIFSDEGVCASALLNDGPFNQEEFLHDLRDFRREDPHHPRVERVPFLEVDGSEGEVEVLLHRKTVARPTNVEPLGQIQTQLGVLVELEHHIERCSLSGSGFGCGEFIAESNVAVVGRRGR